MALRESGPRVRIKRAQSDYVEKLGHIMFSNCDGTFHIKVWATGGPEIDLNPEEVEPC